MKFLYLPGKREVLPVPLCAVKAGVQPCSRVDTAKENVEWRWDFIWRVLLILERPSSSQWHQKDQALINCPFGKYADPSPLKEAMPTKQIGQPTKWSKVGYMSRKKQEILQLPPTMRQLFMPIKTFLFLFSSLRRCIHHWVWTCRTDCLFPKTSNLADEALSVRKLASSSSSAKAIMDNRSSMKVVESVGIKVRPLVSRSVHIVVPNSGSANPEAHATRLLSYCVVAGRQYNFFRRGRNFR